MGTRLKVNSLPDRLPNNQYISHFKKEIGGNPFIPFFSSVCLLSQRLIQPLEGAWRPNLQGLFLAGIPTMAGIEATPHQIFLDLPLTIQLSPLTSSVLASPIRRQVQLELKPILALRKELPGQYLTFSTFANKELSLVEKNVFNQLCFTLPIFIREIHIASALIIQTFQYKNCKYLHCVGL